MAEQIGMVEGEDRKIFRPPSQRCVERRPPAASAVGALDTAANKAGFVRDQATAMASRGYARLR